MNDLLILAFALIIAGTAIIIYFRIKRKRKINNLRKTITQIRNLNQDED